MIFHEVTGKYYEMVDALITMAQETELNMAHLQKLIQQKGFEESMLHFLSRLTDETNSDYYGLFNRSGDTLQPIVKVTPHKNLTHLEKSWLKSLLEDPRIHLFFKPELFKQLSVALEAVPLLYQPSDYVEVGKSNDGDLYTSEEYISNFQILLSAIQNKKLLNLEFNNAEGHKRTGAYAPVRLEYSLKDDKFRLIAVRINRGNAVFFGKINLSRISAIEIIEHAKYPLNLEAFIRQHKMPEPIEIELKNDRNGFDRCFVHLSHYERVSEYNEETNTCRIKIDYYDIDEAELLITLLSYGPILKVIGPETFRKKIVERLLQQGQLNEFNINA